MPNRLSARRANPLKKKTGNGERQAGLIQEAKSELFVVVSNGFNGASIHRVLAQELLFLVFRLLADE